jgi:hypothetical protein
MGFAKELNPSYDAILLSTNSPIRSIAVRASGIIRAQTCQACGIGGQTARRRRHEQPHDGELPPQRRHRRLLVGHALDEQAQPQADDLGADAQAMLSARGIPRSMGQFPADLLDFCDAQIASGPRLRGDWRVPNYPLRSERPERR